MVGRVAVRDRPCFCPLAVPTSFSYHFSPSNLDSARNNICFGDFATPEQNRVVYLYVYICILHISVFVFVKMSGEICVKGGATMQLSRWQEAPEW